MKSPTGRSTNTGILAATSRPSGRTMCTAPSTSNRGPLNVDNAEAALALGLVGLGLIRLGDFVVAEAVREGRLVPLLAGLHHVEPVPTSLVFPPGRQRLPRLRVFIDFVAVRFQASPWRIDEASAAE